jgi:hypothetical protein
MSFLDELDELAAQVKDGPFPQSLVLTLEGG